MKIVVTDTLMLLFWVTVIRICPYFGSTPSIEFHHMHILATSNYALYDWYDVWYGFTVNRCQWNGPGFHAITACIRSLWQCDRSIEIRRSKVQSQ